MLRHAPLCSRAPEHRQRPSGLEFIEAKDVEASIMAADLDVAVVRPVPLVERFANLDLMPAETEPSGHRRSAVVSMLLDINAHFLVPVIRNHTHLIQIWIAPPSIE
jgi:hypothetical protein